MTVSSTIRDAVLRIGEVTAVEGRLIYVLVDKRKNLSHMFLDGELLTNIAVGSYLEIRKGFLSIIGRVEGERIEDDFRRQSTGSQREPTDRSRRVLTVALAGYIDEQAAFRGGARELPLIGNEAFLLTSEKLRRVHDLTADAPLSISIATLYGDDSEVRLPVDGLFNSHIAIFGNTGSGKSNTLAYLYQELIHVLRNRNPAAFEANTKFVIIDFNGEYASQSCITQHKTIYNLSTRADADKLPLGEQSLLELEVLAILADATEKTQKPFVGRALSLVKRIKAAADGQPQQFFRNLIRKLVRRSLETRDRATGATVLNYFQANSARSGSERE